MAEEKRAYENFYQGTPSLLDPKYGELFTGYRGTTGRIGAPTSIQTADQIKEVSSRLSEGMKVIELQPISPEVFETMPKDQLKEVNRLAKLTGGETTIHSPIIDPAGFPERGSWTEGNREISERRLLDVVKRSHDVNPKGNVPVTIHASWMPSMEERVIKEGEKRIPVKEMVVAINQETGEVSAAKREERFDPQLKLIKTYEPKEMIDIRNNTQWLDSITNLQVFKKHADELLEKSWLIAAPAWNDLKTGKRTETDLKPAEINAMNDIRKGMQFYRDINSRFTHLYEEAYKYVPTDKKERVQKNLRVLAEEWRSIQSLPPSEMSFEYDKMIQNLSNPSIIPTPEITKPIEEFALDKASRTLGNVAFETYQKFGDTSPIISVENVFPNVAFSKAEQLKDLIEESRKKFVENAVKKGMSEGEAKDASKKLIGATWDIGHINLLRKSGYTEKEIIEETKKIAPYVKHVHLTDNFGYADTHLPPGMGNVPIKKMMEELEKKGYTGKQIVEAGGFVQHFKTSPYPYSLEALGSPLYYAAMAPYWNQSRAGYGAFNAGYGAFLPEQHFNLYGSGFATLPAELGGQMPGKGRFAGTPNE